MSICALMAFSCARSSRKSFKFSVFIRLVVFVVIKKGFKLIERHGEPVLEVGGGEDTGIEAASTHDSEIASTAAVFGRSDVLEIVE